MKELWKKKGIKISVLAICILVVCIIAGITAKSISEQKAIAAHMETAQKYLSELDYEQAIAEYMAALTIDPNDQAILDALEQAYLDMAQVQIDVEAYSEAINILDRGYDGLQRKTLLEKRDEVEELQAQKEEEERLADAARLKEEEEKRNAEEVHKTENTTPKTVDSVTDVYPYIGKWKELAGVSEEREMNRYGSEDGDYYYYTDNFYWYGHDAEVNSFYIENRGNADYSFRGVRIGSSIRDAVNLVPGLESSGDDWYCYSESSEWAFWTLVNENGVVVEWTVVGRDEALG